VGRILGHASIGITGDVYRHVDVEEMREEVDRLAMSLPKAYRPDRPKKGKRAAVKGKAKK